MQVGEVVIDRVGPQGLPRARARWSRVIYIYIYIGGGVPVWKRMDFLFAAFVRKILGMCTGIYVHDGNTISYCSKLCSCAIC